MKRGVVHPHDLKLQPDADAAGQIKVSRFRLAQEG